jgi:hypothetical protein
MNAPLSNVLVADTIHGDLEDSVFDVRCTYLRQNVTVKESHAYYKNDQGIRQFSPLSLKRPVSCLY